MDSILYSGTTGSSNVKNFVDIRFSVTLVEVRDPELEMGRFQTGITA